MEFRNAVGQVRFLSLQEEVLPADKGVNEKLKGLTPYTWKAAK